MSSRQLRKLQKQRELAEVQATQDQPSEDEDGDEGVVNNKAAGSKPRVSLFAALGGDDDEDGDNDDEGDHGAVNDAHKSASQEEKEDLPTEKGKSKKKKKKKKAKSKAIPPESGPAPEDSGEDEIDKAIKELKLEAVKGTSDASGGIEVASQTRLNKLLNINTHHLRVLNEMRQLFGRDIIESAQAEEEQQQGGRQRGAARQQVDLETFLRGPPGMKRLPEVSLRRNIFIQGREHWPMATVGGLTMQSIEKAPDGSYTEYAYLHDKEYDAVQGIFFQYVGMGDPMRMVYLLQQFPYHVSTLLQVSFVAKQDQNMALSSELCERALFTFGRVATNAFRLDLEQGRARLDFRRPENRQLWLAGYHYLKSLIRKGTYRTALEWSRLLFSLDHKDPYAMRHYIQFLAIRAYEARWFIDFIAELEASGDNRDTAYLRQSIVLAKLQLEDLEGARNTLGGGMREVPWLYCSLFQELGLDAPPSIWGVNPETESRSFWTQLYIYQMKDLWNNPAAISLLKEVATGLETVDKESAMKTDDPPVDLGTARLVYLESQRSLMALAPRDMLDRQPNYEFDPLPPPEEENLFSGDGCRLPWIDLRRGSAALEPQIEAQLRRLMDHREAAVGLGRNFLPGGFGGADDDSDDQDEPLDDGAHPTAEELRAHLEERHRAGDTEGWMNALVNMFRRPAPPADNQQGGPGGESRGPGERLDEGPLPGAWPEEDNDEDGGVDGGGGDDRAR